MKRGLKMASEFDLFDQALAKYMKENPPEINEDLCSHNEVNIEDGITVCLDCGEQLQKSIRCEKETGFMDRTQMRTPYSIEGQLTTIDNYIIRFIEKVKLELHPDMVKVIRERIYKIKEQNNFSRINYPIMFSLHIQDKENQERIKPFLPASEDSWKKNREMFEKSK